MGENTKIEWTDHTANFWWGCFKVSAGCANCYAETWANRWGKSIWGPPSTTDREYKKSAWADLPKWNAKAKAEGVRRRVFVQSMSDFFEDHPQVFPWRNEALQLMAECTNLDFQVLTKRPENIMRMLPTKWTPHKWGRIPDHIWIGTSVEDQEQADKRIPELLKIPASVRFLSMEPLLGAVDLRNFEYGTERGLTIGYDWLTGTEWQHSSIFGGGNPYLSKDDVDEYGDKRINWIVAGGESGPSARPMRPDWVRSIRDQCQSAGVPFFFKQWGEYWPSDQGQWLSEAERHVDHDSDNEFHKIGKRAAGRMLDGREWNDVPVTPSILDE